MRTKLVKEEKHTTRSVVNAEPVILKGQLLDSSDNLSQVVNTDGDGMAIASDTVEFGYDEDDDHPIPMNRKIDLEQGERRSTVE